MNPHINYKAESSHIRGIDLALLLLALFGFWEFTLSSWPFKSQEFDDLWPTLQDSPGIQSFLETINAFASTNSRVLEVIPTLVAEACFVSYVLGRTKLFVVFGMAALVIFATTLHFTNFTHANHPYYDFLMLAVMVLAPGCIHSLRVAYALTYFMCALLKLNEGWITGSFFLSADGYLPFAPVEAIPYLTNLMIAFQMFGCFLLLSRGPRTRRMTASVFILFHLYSIIIAGSRFSWSTFPFLVLLFMLPQDSDRSGESSYRARWSFLISSIDDVKSSLQNTRLLAAAVVTIFLFLQGFSYLNVISEKRTFNMFSEATSCVVTVAGSGLFQRYGHPVGSSACFKDQVMRMAKQEFCSTSGDFDLRLEVSRNASKYRIEHEQLSVCKNQVESNYLPPVNAEVGYKTQAFIYPVRTSEKVDVTITADGAYELKPSVTSRINQEFWLVAKFTRATEANPSKVGIMFAEMYRCLLLLLWIALSAMLITTFYKKPGQ